ncbi:MAG: phosphate ABC transporter substrate-binding/OmpA family protein [Pseudomonadota bacterium]
MIHTCLRRGSAVGGFAALLAMTAPMALAEQVTLRSSDGTINITGDFIEFAGNVYTIRTALGELRMSADRVSCEGDACPTFATADADLRFAGSDTVGLGIMPLLLEGFGGFKDAEVTTTATGVPGEMISTMVGDAGFGDEMGDYLVNSTVSGDAFKALDAQTADIGMASRRIRPEEARGLRDAGAGNMVSPRNEHIIAIDSLVVVTHPDNPVSRLTMDQLAGIYSGRITNWAELGGDNAPILVIDRPDGSGTRSVFKSRILGTSDVPVLPGAVTAVDNNEVAAIANADPNAIGYTGYAFRRGAKALPLENECGITMTPDAFSARTEEYALQRRLYLYNRGDDLSPRAQEFLDFALSSDADGVIKKAGFIDLGIDRRPQQLDGDRARALLNPNVDAYEGGVMREMMAVMVDYDRLSTTFRFRTGSSKLDERGIVDMARLTDYLADQPQGTKVMFVGFTDDVGAFDSNRELSTARATQVLREMQAYAGGALPDVEMAAVGFGEIAPAACNSSDTGRGINRRVEVWISAAG